MSDKSVIDEWLEIANNDLDAAQYLFERSHHRQLEIICYHCQQSAEKSLKAYLCANDIEIPRIHEVGVLCRQCAELNPLFSDYIKTCEILEIYATQTRYPNQVELDEQSASQALEQAESIYNFVAKLLR